MRRLEDWASCGGGHSSSGCGQQVWHSGGLLGGRRGTQAGVLAADG